jgi:light-regulated signal transduction histidine kinase (bacteriophytochrome)
MNNPDLLTNIIHPEDRPLFLNHIKNLQDASHEGMELKIVSKSGQIRWLAHICSPLYMQHKFLGRRISNRDITDRKNAEEELRKYREHLEELVEQRTAELKKMADELTRSNKDLKEFAYVVSHDLKEPLQVIKGFLMLFEKRYKDKLDEKANEIIRFTVDGAKRMQELIKDLLEYSQVGTKGKEFKPADCSLILNKAISNLKVSIEESGAVVTHDTLPTVTADAIQLSRLFQNLIGNAIKFHGSEAPMVHISTERKGDEWLFSVRDNGIGIDPKFADRIFAVFQRLHSSDEYPGTGIGLAICKKIVEHHGGRIWVESEPGKGATFYFIIPERQANT